VWAAQANKIAFYFNGWRDLAPVQKLKFFLEGVSAWWTYSGSAWTADPVTAVNVLDDLSNVSVATPADGAVLQYDLASGQWVADVFTAVASMATLTDVNLSGLTGGMVLQWNATISRWVPVTLPTGATNLDQLSDVDASGASNGEVLMWDSGSGVARWQPLPYGSYPQLNDLTDVVTAGADPGDVLAWNGSAWGPSPAVITYSFLGMVDGPGTFDGNADKLLVVDPTESEMVFKSLGELLSTTGIQLQVLSDVQAPTDPNIGRFLQLRKVGSVFDYIYAVPTDTKVEVRLGGTVQSTGMTSINFVGFNLTEPTPDVFTLTAPVYQANGTPVGGPTISAINFTGAVGLTNSGGVLTVTVGGGDLNSLSDVNAPSPTNNQQLVWNTSTSRWVMRSKRCNLCARRSRSRASGCSMARTIGSRTSGRWCAR
jgi:hypothetical protein